MVLSDFWAVPAAGRHAPGGMRPVIETLDGDLLYPHLHKVGFSLARKADRVADRMAKQPAGATAEFLPYQTEFWSASPVR